MKPKYILVTGAGKGLGYALTEEAIRNGIRVVAVVRSIADSERLQKQFGAQCLVITADITQPESEQIIFTGLAVKDITLDVIINNAGITGVGPTLGEVDFMNLRDLLAVHCIAALRCVRAALGSLRRSAQPVILNVSSRLSSITSVAEGRFNDESHSYAYRIAKASQNMATACLHAEFGKAGIIVLALNPGKIKTAFSGHSEGNTAPEAAARIFSLIGQINPGMSGSFVDLEGNRMVW